METTKIITDHIFVFFLAIFLGVIISRIKVKDVSLGTMAVLISGLILGTFGFKLPDFVKNFGIILFLYALGVQVGPNIFSIFKKENINYFWLSSLFFGLSTGIYIILARIMGLSRELATGIYCGILSSATALANIISTHPSPSMNLSFSLSYPLSLFIYILFILFLIHYFKLQNISSESLDIKVDNPINIKKEEIVKKKIIVTKSKKKPHIDQLEDKFGVVISELNRGMKSELPNHDDKLKNNDVILVEGYESNVNQFEKETGKVTQGVLKRTDSISSAPILLTNRDIGGKTIQEIQPKKRFNCLITKIWRSGVTIPAPGSWVKLEIGDTLVVTGEKENLEQFAHYIGRTTLNVDDLDFFSMSLVVLLGIILGQLQIESPLGGGIIKLGVAGGIFVVALMVGYFRRVGFVYGQLSPAARSVTKDLGLMLFMPAVGMDAGNLLREVQLTEVMDILSSTLIFVFIYIILIFILMNIFWRNKKTATVVAIFTASLKSALAMKFLVDQTGSEDLMIPYASIYPLMILASILISQLIYIFF
ncbi:MAG: TrkA C-terminal domain-containing protein [Vulcanimicrobiota bacterium]